MTKYEELICEIAAHDPVSGSQFDNLVNSWIVRAKQIVVDVAPAPKPDKSDVDAEWVKVTAEAIIKSNVKLSPNAQTFVAHTFARASQYKSVRFSPKQWSWFNSIMVDAGVEAIDLPVEVTP